jgi:hypothetical protein
VTGSHRLIRCTPDELFDLLRACCADQSAAASRELTRRRRPGISSRDLLSSASGSFEPRRARMVSTAPFGRSQWQLTCDQGAHGSIAHLQFDSTHGLARWLPRHVRTVYLTAVGDRMLQTLNEYARQRATPDDPAAPA